MGIFDKLKKKEPMPVIKKDPAEEQFQIAMGFSNQEKHQEALQAFRKVLELDPNYQPDTVHYGIALAYDAQGMNDFAIEELRRVLSYNPTHIEAHIIMGTILARQNRFQDATAEYQTALRMAPFHELADEMKKSIAVWTADTTGETVNNLRNDLAAFMKQAQEQFKLKLDYSPESLAKLDGLIDAGWNPQSGGMGVLRIAGTYFGEVMLKNLGGEWRTVQPVEESEIAGLGRNGIKPFYIALDKFKKGKAGSLFESYKEIAAEIHNVQKSMYG
jgi:tetratricopeptide (TPR) repeat protein